MLWNYRGYGRSTGTPKPQLIQSDGETIIDFFRKELKVQKIGIHGQSLGGILACHLAQKCNLDFLCADRTFSSFSDVVAFSFSSLAAKFFQIISNWNENNAAKFTKSKCYKVVTYDPKDEIINYLSSLQAGILKEAIYDRICSKNDELVVKKRNSNIFENFIDILKQKAEILKNDKKNILDFDNYYDCFYFSNNEFDLIYNAFLRIMEIIVETSKHKSNFKKNHRRFVSSDDAQMERIKNKAKEQKTAGIPIVGNTGSLDSSLNVTNISVLNISSFKEESIVNSNDVSVSKSTFKEDNSVIFNIQNENMLEENEENKSNQIEMKIPIGENNDYLELLTDKEKNSEKFQNFILEVAII